jgi:hypothetical protein
VERGGEVRVQFLDPMVVVGCMNIKHWKFQCLPSFRNLYRISQGASLHGSWHSRVVSAARPLVC